MQDDPRHYMRVALNVAAVGLARDELPIGAVVVLDGRIVATAHTAEVSERRRARSSRESTTCSMPTFPRGCSSPVSTRCSTQRAGGCASPTPGMSRPTAGTTAASELWATGMPLGMMPGTRYEEYEATLAPGETLLVYSDGLVEAHSASDEMFGFPRPQTVLEGYADGAAHDGDAGASLIESVLSELRGFTGEG
jgi:Stage II sporulation protein E (SpoIIE)